MYNSYLGVLKIFLEHIIRPFRWIPCSQAGVTGTNSTNLVGLLCRLAVFCVVARDAAAVVVARSLVLLVNEDLPTKRQGTDDFTTAAVLQLRRTWAHNLQKISLSFVSAGNVGGTRHFTTVIISIYYEKLVYIRHIFFHFFLYRYIFTTELANATMSRNIITIWIQ